MKLRRAHGISQEQLAADAGVDRRYLSDVENDKRNLSVGIVEKLASRFGLSLSQFFGLVQNHSLEDIKEALCSAEYPEAVVFECPDYAEAFIGISHDGRAVYNYDLMVASLVAEGMTADEAMEFIDYNTLRAIPYMGPEAPIVLMPPSI